MSRGGKRQGRVGANYANRSDLRQGPTQPVQTATGQPYGAATQQAEQQRQVPLQNGGPPVPVQTAQPSTFGDPSKSVGENMVGLVGQLIGPSQRNAEPVTAGAATGPGAGPEALQLSASLNVNSVSSMLATLADASQSTDLKVLAQHAQQLGQ